MRKHKRLKNENFLIRIDEEGVTTVNRLKDDLTLSQFDTIRAYDLIPAFADMVAGLILAATKEGFVSRKDNKKLIDNITDHLEQRILIDDEDSDLLLNLGLKFE